MSQEIIESTKEGSKPVTFTRAKNSKKDKARELYVQYIELPRDQIIQKFIEELDMPESSARTYVSVCAKELNEKHGKEFKPRNVNRANSKRAKAFQIFKDNVITGGTGPQFDRKVIIEIYKATLGMTHNSAATHCSLAYKAYFGKNVKV